jgi:hypothetical protein
LNGLRTIRISKTLRVLEVAGRIAQLSFFFLRRSFFAADPDCGFRIGFAAISEPKSFKTGSSVTLANEVERSNILAPGFRSRVCETHLLPAFTPESFRGLAYGKSYPVTAAQLLPIFTGFLAPVHFSKLAKN